MSDPATPPAPPDEAEAIWLERRVRSLQRRRDVLRLAPAAALPVAAFAGYFHPLWGAIIMAAASVLWLFGLAQNLETTDALHQRLLQQRRAKAARRRSAAPH